MSSCEDTQILLHVAAADLAFRTGQLVEKLLWERGVESARSSQESIVTRDIVESCINESLFEDLRKLLNEQAQQESQRVA